MLLSRTQAGPGRTGKQEQEEISPKARTKNKSHLCTDLIGYNDTIGYFERAIGNKLNTMSVYGTSFMVYNDHLISYSGHF